MEHLIGEKVESLVCRLHAVTKLHLGKVNICFFGLNFWNFYIFVAETTKLYQNVY